MVIRVEQGNGGRDRYVMLSRQLLGILRARVVEQGDQRPRADPPASGRCRQRWVAKFGQADKWKICLKAARVPRPRRRELERSHSSGSGGFPGSFVLSLVEDRCACRFRATS
jgi:hypothetical protein